MACLSVVAATAHARELPIVVGAPSPTTDYTFARQAIPADSTPTSTVAQSKVIYLNRTGVTVSPGDNDARVNKTTLTRSQTQIPAWNTSETTWNATVDCVRELFAPFDVSIVTTDPGPNVPHIEAVFGGTPNLLGMESSVAGVAPFKSDCTILENAMVFTFTANMPDDPRFACEVQAQEIAHAYGLDHEMLPSDPLTYLRYDGNRSFQNQLAECGEDKARACGISGSPSCRGKQNSVELLFERLGAKAAPGDVTPPTLTITSPADGAIVTPGFEIEVSASDNARVTLATIYVDDVPSGSSSVAPWTIKAPQNILSGTRKIRIEVTDGRNTRSSEIRVTVEGGTDPTTTDGDLTGGCSARGGARGLVFVVVVLFVLFRTRRSETRHP